MKTYKIMAERNGGENQAEIKSLIWLFTIDWVAKKNLILHFVILSVDFIGPAKKIALFPYLGRHQLASDSKGVYNHL